MDVTNRTTHSDRVYSFPSRLKNGRPALGRQAFAASDVNARRYGWQVTRIKGGLSQNYRDARVGYGSTCAPGSGGGCIARGTLLSEHSLNESAP
jgi:hypothetical protein